MSSSALQASKNFCIAVTALCSHPPASAFNLLDLVRCNRNDVLRTDDIAVCAMVVNSSYYSRGRGCGVHLQCWRRPPPCHTGSGLRLPNRGLCQLERTSVRRRRRCSWGACAATATAASTPRRCSWRATSPSRGARGCSWTCRGCHPCGCFLARCEGFFASQTSSNM